MPKHETGNTFYWITWEVNIVWQWNLVSLCHIKKIIKIFFEKRSLENSSKIFLIFKESSVNQQIWTDFNSFANTHLMQVALFKSFIFQ